MRPVKKLTNFIVRTADVGRYSDGGGLYLDVKSPQSRFWSYRYTVAGKAREMGLGPAGLAGGAIPLSEARKKVATLQRAADAGIDPLEDIEIEAPNLYQEYVLHRDELDEGRARLNTMIAAGSAPPEYYDDPERAWACLSGDSSVQHDLVRARHSPDLPPIWEANLKGFRALGQSTQALLAIALWPGDRPLAPELRWFLQRALSPLVEATSVDAEVKTDTALKQVILNLGLVGGARGKHPALSEHRRKLDASRAEALMEEAMKTEKNRKTALFVVCQKMGIKRTALEELLVEGAAITKAEKDAAADTM